MIEQLNKNLTIADIADALGVSKTTVSRAISGKGRISEATRERVKAYMKENNYKPNIIAQGLAQSRTYNIGVVMPSDYGIEDISYFQNCMVGLQEKAASRGYDIVLVVCNNDNLTQLKRIVDNGKVDGVVLMRTFINDEATKYLIDEKKPFVVIGSSEYEDVVQIDQNHYEGCKELTSMLLLKQMKRIALIGGDEAHMVTRSRLKGFMDAHKELGVPVCENLIYMDQNNTRMIERAVDDIFMDRVDCIICMDDMICSSVLSKIQRENMIVPDDVRIASFFDSMLLRNHIPSITSLRFNVKEAGRVAGDRLIDILEGKEVDKITLLGYKTDLKDSTKF